MDPQVRVCDPFEARDFNKEIEFMSADVCKVRRDSVVQDLDLTTKFNWRIEVELCSIVSLE